MYSCDLLICPRSAECSQVWCEMLNRRNLAEAVKPTPLSLSYSKCGIFARNAWKMRYSSISKTNHWLLWHFRDEAVVVPLQPWRCQWTDGKSSFPTHGTKSVVELGGGGRVIVTIKMRIMMTMTMTIVMMMLMPMTGVCQPARLLHLWVWSWLQCLWWRQQGKTINHSQICQPRLVPTK